MMEGNITGMLIAAAAFALTFGVARTIVRWRNRRQAERDREQALRSQSRQVRRAQERERSKRR